MDLPPPERQSFDDVAGDTHEVNINKAAGAGLTSGTSAGAVSPGAAVRRDQMASFLARTLNRLVVDGHMTAEPSAAHTHIES